MSRPTDSTKSHYVLATGMTVDKTGNPFFITNNPGMAKGQDVARTADSSQIKGYTLYRPTNDPSMIFMHLTGNTDMVITDPNGRRSGYNPVTKEFFSEIPGGSYYFADSISSPDNANIFSPPETRFEDLDPVSGEYHVQIFAKANTSFQLTSYSFDANGTINGISDKKGSLKAGVSSNLSIQHSIDPISIRSANLNIERADFYDLRYRDMAFLSGKVKPTDEHSIISIDNYVQIKVGKFSKSIDKKDLRKYKDHGHTIYTYGALGKKGLFIEINADTGEFNLLIVNADIDNGDTSLTTDVALQIDDIIAKNVVTFKEIRKKKCNGH